MAGHKGQKHPGKQHPVVAVYPDGSMMGWFEFIKDVAAIYGGFDRHGISRACKGHNGGIYKGIRWCYKEEYDRLWSQGRTHELAYTLTKYQHPGRQASHPPGQLTPEGRATKSRKASEVSRRMAADPNSRWGKPKPKPIYCITNGITYEGRKQAAQALGLKPHQISAALTRGGKCHGYAFKNPTTITTTATI